MIRILLWSIVLTILLGGSSLRANSSEDEQKLSSLKIYTPVILGSITNFFRGFFLGHQAWEIWTGDHAKIKNSIEGELQLSDEEFQMLIKKSEQEKIGMRWVVTDRDTQADLLSKGLPKEKVTLQNGKYDEKWIYSWAEVYFKNGKVRHVEFIQKGLDELDQPVIAYSSTAWK